MPGSARRRPLCGGRRAASVAVAVCAILGLEAAAGYNLSPSERDAAERIAMISHNQVARCVRLPGASEQALAGAVPFAQATAPPRALSVP